jgi:hypothetical protein
MLCHLANISLRSGKSINCNPINGQMINETEAQKLWSRTYEKGWEPVL